MCSGVIALQFFFLCSKSLYFEISMFLCIYLDYLEVWRILSQLGEVADRHGNMFRDCSAVIIITAFVVMSYYNNSVLTNIS